MHFVEGHVIATIYSNCNIDFWDIKDLSNIEFIKRRDAHSGPILSITNTSVGSYITGSEDGTLCLWNIDSKGDQTLVELKKKRVVNSDVNSSERIILDAVAVSQIHGQVALGDNQGFIKLYSLKDLAEEGQYNSRNLRIKIIEFAGIYMQV